MPPERVVCNFWVMTLRARLRFAADFLHHRPAIGWRSHWLLLPEIPYFTSASMPFRFDKRIIKANQAVKYQSGSGQRAGEVVRDQGSGVRGRQLARPRWITRLAKWERMKISKRDFRVSGET